MDAARPQSLLSFLAQVPDHRSRHGRQHPLAAILGLACCAILCGCKGYSAIAQWAHDHDIALMHRLGFTRTPPTMWGIRKALLALDVGAFEAALSRWAQAVLGRAPAGADDPPQALALDGKTACGSFDGLKKAVHLLSLVAHESGLTLAQAAVPNGVADKTNEHKAALGLLEGLVLHGRLVTGDAIFCQRDFCQQVVDQGGDYLVIVKDNQPTLRADIAAAFAPESAGALSPPAAAALG
jgi:DDE_Tnp_1-associated/Transposase DDE domain